MSKLFTYPHKFWSTCTGDKRFDVTLTRPLLKGISLAYIFSLRLNQVPEIKRILGYSFHHHPWNGKASPVRIKTISLKNKMRSY